jgi:enamine deaminase RidA (YjgF/YER057c/UK114 family)
MLGAALLSPSILAAAETNVPANAVIRSERHARDGRAKFVRVPDGPLVFTGLVTAADPESARRALAATLAQAGSDLSRVVRLNAYVAKVADVPSVEQTIATHFANTPVAFTLIRSPLTAGDAVVAFEAVATTSRTGANVEIVDPLAAILPAGRKAFISGQAERGPDVATAVKLTMAGLHRTLAHLKLKKADIVQVKAFLQPFADHAAATREIAASFDGAAVPPMVLIEWVSELHTEIELVVAANGSEPASREPITFAWLPWLANSTRYSRVTQVAAGTPLIFLSGISGGDAGDARAQMKVIFERIGSTLFDAGSSYRHLAKATYYLVDPQARAALGEIRDVYYDPTRPPAASALEVTSLGRPDRAALVELIAVPTK